VLREVEVAIWLPSTDNFGERAISRPAPLLTGRGSRWVAFRMKHSGTPAGVPFEHDCALRESAWRFGRARLPAQGAFKSLYDALQLGACGVAPMTDRPEPPRAVSPPGNGPYDLVVNPAATAGDHEHGNLLDAIEASRSIRRQQALPDGARITIYLRGGTHYLRQTLQLDARDSGTTIRSYPGESAALSGGVPLSTKWRRSHACGGRTRGADAGRACWEAMLKSEQPEVRHMGGLRLHGQRQIRARFPNADPEVGSDGSAQIGGQTLGMPRRTVAHRTRGNFNSHRTSTTLA
jgi:hypothetical protein